MSTRFSTQRQKVPISAPPALTPELPSPRAFLAVALGLVAVVFAVYSPALQFQFVLDDHRFLADPRIQSSGHVWDYFANYVWAQFAGGPPSFYRPLFILWLRINFLVSGMSPWGWHLLSIMKHVAVAALLGLLVWRLLNNRIAAVLAATLFALHPAQTESVAWVTVPDPLMSLGILGSVLLYLRYELGVSPSQAQGKKPRKLARTNKKSTQAPVFWLIASAGACLAALFTKETAIVLPPVIFALSLIMSPGHKKEDAGLGVRLLRAFRVTLPFVCVTAFYLLLRLNAFGGKLGAQTQNLSWKTVLLSWPATLWFYVKVLLWPVQSRAFADPTLAERFSFRNVFLPALGVVCALAALTAVLFCTRSKARRDLPQPEAANVEYALLIGMLLFALPILLTLDLNALNPGDFLHGRYTYLPSAGLMLLLATGWHVAGKMQIPLLCAGGLLALVFSMLVFSQEKQWQDDLTVFTVAHQLAPHNDPVAQNLANAHVQMALQLADSGRCSEAMPVFEQVTEQYPQNWYAWAGLADCFVQLNNLPKAEEALHRAADISHNPRVMQQWQELRANMGLPTSVPHE